MSQASALVAAAWRDGVGADDLDDARAIERAIGVEDDEDADRGAATLFAALAQLVTHQRAALPAAPADAATAVVHAAACVLDAVLADDRAGFARVTTTLGARIGALAPHDRHVVAATAWADLALARVAIRIGDRHVARSRLEAVAATDRPVALRLDAMIELAGLAIERADVEASRTWARKAATLADARGRPHELARARRVLGLLAYATGDRAAMDASHGLGDPLEQLLQATNEPGLAAGVRLTSVLEEAAERGDALIYALTILVGARWYDQLGHPDDARTMLDAGVTQLANRAPHLVYFLEQAWRERPGS